MFYAKRHTEFLERELEARAARITVLEQRYEELVNKSLFGVTPLSVLETKIAQEKAWRARDKETTESSDAPKDALSTAESLAVAETARKHNLSE